MPHHHGYLVLVLPALGASGVVQYRVASSARALSWLLLVWFIVAPYSHAYATALLVVPLAVLGPLSSVCLLDCWLCTAPSVYSLPTVVAAAPLIIMGAWPHYRRLTLWGARCDHNGPSANIFL